MQYAIVDGRRSKPVRGQRGICQYCGEEMVAKCGQFVIWHWAHMPKRNCDPWWDSESEWHREWKERFPEDWREIIHIDELSGEKHIADVKTPSGTVVEFQRSPISSKEVTSREEFYQTMVWVIDGDRGTLDTNYFRMGLVSEPVSLDPLVHIVEWWSSSRTLQKWSMVDSPVYIDFGRHGLWRLLDFNVANQLGFVSPMDPEKLVEYCTAGDGNLLSVLPAAQKESWVERFDFVEYSLSDSMDRDQTVSSSDVIGAKDVSPPLST